MEGTLSTGDCVARLIVVTRMRERLTTFAGGVVGGLGDFNIQLYLIYIILLLLQSDSRRRHIFLVLLGRLI